MDLTEKYDGLIFDCDGTLTDSMPLHFVAWRDTLAKHSIDFSEERFYAMGGMPTDQIVSVLSKEQSVQVDAKSVAAEKEQAFIANIKALKPKNEVCEIVRQYVGKIPLAVASGSERDTVILQLQMIGLTKQFDAIVAAEDTDKHKAEPDVFLKAAELLGVSPNKCLVYEDSPLGIQAAQAAGMDYVDVR